MNLDEGVGTAETCAERDLVAHEEGPALEPYIGMEFESEEAAKEFYDGYARRLGFVMRIDQCRRSEVDKRILSRRLSCNKQGFPVKARGEVRHVRKPRSRSREGCQAMMLVKVNKSGKWAVSRFVRDHTHPLIVSDCPSLSSLVSYLTSETTSYFYLCSLMTSLLNRVKLMLVTVIQLPNQLEKYGNLYLAY